MPVGHRLGFASRLSGVAGPAAFQRRLRQGLAAYGVTATEDLTDAGTEAILVIGATRHLAGLARARRRGIPIIQRLDGRNWIHRRRRTGLRHFARAEWSNLLLRWTRDRLATAVVYQSEFVRQWWERECGPTPVSASVIHNGVDLDQYTPIGAEKLPADRRRVLVVEARFGGGYEIGLEWSLELARRLAQDRKGAVELWIAGSTTEGAGRMRSPQGVSISWLGVISPEAIPGLNRSAHILFSSDLHPACPNSVIEAMACGLPVVAFDTGALAELVRGEGGRLVPYGADSWRVEPPDLEGLAAAAREVMSDGHRFRNGARRQAETWFSLERMTQAYLAVFGW